MGGGEGAGGQIYWWLSPPRVALPSECSDTCSLQVIPNATVRVFSSNKDSNALCVNCFTSYVALTWCNIVLEGGGGREGEEREREYSAFMSCYSNSDLASRRIRQSPLHNSLQFYKYSIYTLPNLPVLLNTVIKPTVSLGHVKEWVEGTFKTIECHLNEFGCCLKIFIYFAHVRQLNVSIYMIRVLTRYCLE